VQTVAKTALGKWLIKVQKDQRDDAARVAKLASDAALSAVSEYRAAQDSGDLTASRTPKNQFKRHATFSRPQTSSKRRGQARRLKDERGVGLVTVWKAELDLAKMTSRSPARSWHAGHSLVIPGGASIFSCKWHGKTSVPARVKYPVSTSTQNRLPDNVRHTGKQTVHECIHGVKTAMSLAGISKDNTNKEQKFKFRSIDDVINALSDQFVAHRLTWCRALSTKPVSRPALPRRVQLFGELPSMANSTLSRSMMAA